MKGTGNASLTSRHRNPADCFPQLESWCSVYRTHTRRKRVLDHGEYLRATAIMTGNEISKCFTIAKSFVPKRARWPVVPTAFDFKITNRPGPLDMNADALSLHRNAYQTNGHWITESQQYCLPGHSVSDLRRLPPSVSPRTRANAAFIHRDPYSAMGIHSPSANSAVCKAVHSAACEDHRPPHGSRKDRHDGTRDHYYATRLRKNIKSLDKDERLPPSDSDMRRRAIRS
jgi:hypothetical protein